MKPALAPGIAQHTEAVKMLRSGEVQKKYTSRGKHSGYTVEIFHDGLQERKLLSASDIALLEEKANKQGLKWQAAWERKQKQEAEKDKAKRAEELTIQYRQQLEAIEGLLAHTLEINDAVDWNSLKRIDTFKTPLPKNVGRFANLGEPDLSEYLTKPGLITRLLRRAAQHSEMQVKLFEKDHAKWRAEVDSHEKRLKSWHNAKSNFEAKRTNFNRKIDTLRENYQAKKRASILEYCEMVLERSQYPDGFPKNYELDYNETNGILVLDYQLPSPEQIPNKVSVRYIKSADRFDKKTLSAAAHTKLFESAIYQIALRTIHELFEADVINAIATISLNGFVTMTNPASGHEETKCIVSVQSEKSEFLKINLAAVDPKTCFKSLKGVAAAQLSSITSVRPILQLDKTDRRFRDHYEVASEMDESTNLAAMDWEDFEHLVREIFENEFAKNGGEVKVTQASADGGVDAIAFDPDPIRGGKIVIQAKRYTNTVPVSAVRDLYGTVMNEGATKGILVTTSDYGGDSYEFAKDKPITLMNGSNLLHLLEQHGHKAKIDIRQAKQLLRND